MKDVVILTGAGQIGMAIARRVSMGKKLVIGDKSRANGETITKIMNEAGFDAVFVECDLSSRESILNLISEAQKYGDVKAVASSFADSNDIATVTSDLCDQIDVLYIPTDNQAAAYAETIASIVNDKKVPVIAGEEGICKACGVATLSIDYYELGVVTGEMAVRVLTGSDISTMPIEYFPQPVKKYNPEMAAAYNVEIPADFEPLS